MNALVKAFHSAVESEMSVALIKRLDSLDHVEDRHELLRELYAERTLVIWRVRMRFPELDQWQNWSS